MCDVLNRSRVAALERNWSLLVQCLQEWGNRERGLGVSRADLQQVLSWALEVLAFGDFQDRWEIGKVFVHVGTIAIAPLIEIIEDEEADLEERWFAIKILGNFDFPDAIATLVEVVKSSESEELSSIAADTLANLGSSAIASLTSLLLLEESRQFATVALAQIRQAEVIAPLLSVARDRVPSVRIAAIEGLSSFHDPRIPPLLIELLKDPVVEVRKEAAIALGLRSYLDDELGLVNLLKPLLKDISLEVNLATAIALGRIKTDAAAAVLFELFSSPLTPLALQLEAVRALGWMETITALELLEKVLIKSGIFQSEVVDRSPGLEIVDDAVSILSLPFPVIQEIVIILGRVANSNVKNKAADILINLLKNGRSKVVEYLKKSLVVGLGNLGDMRAIETVIAMLADSDSSVKFHCIATLKQLDSQGIRQQLEQLLNQENIKLNLKQGIAIALQEW
ncbi:PBS lyase [Oscillatoriales cyanobacterium USR001]|nr:PBS lyase [Oscillatoriales cyanobacterium USR001]